MYRRMWLCSLVRRTGNKPEIYARIPAEMHIILFNRKLANSCEIQQEPSKGAVLRLP